MMMQDYTELLMDNLGEMFEYALNDCGYDQDYFINMFLNSKVCEGIENKSPQYLYGKTGIEYVLDILNPENIQKPLLHLHDRSVEYWAGWILMYLHIKTNLKFKDLSKYGYDFKKITSLYIYHEASEDKFVEDAIKNIKEKIMDMPTNLKLQRTYMNYTQEELALHSGVSYRMIKAYEQRKNDINKAETYTLLKLSKALMCNIEDLVEPVFE